MREINKVHKKYVKKPRTYGIEYRRSRNQLNNKIKLAKKNYYNNLLNEASGNSKQTWKVINQILNRNSSGPNVIKSLNVDDNEVTSPEGIVNTLNDYFVSIGEKLSNNIPAVNSSHMDFLGDACPNNLTFRPVTTEYVVKVINELKVSSAGYDNIHINILKSSSNILSPILTQIINQSLSNGIFPDKLKRSRLIPLFKNGSCLKFGAGKLDLYSSISGQGESGGALRKLTNSMEKQNTAGLHRKQRLAPQ